MPDKSDFTPPSPTPEQAKAIRDHAASWAKYEADFARVRPDHPLSGQMEKLLKKYNSGRPLTGSEAKKKASLMDQIRGAILQFKYENEPKLESPEKFVESVKSIRNGNKRMRELLTYTDTGKRAIVGNPAKYPPADENCIDFDENKLRNQYRATRLRLEKFAPIVPDINRILPYREDAGRGLADIDVWFSNALGLVDKSIQAIPNAATSDTSEEAERADSEAEETRRSPDTIRDEATEARAKYCYEEGQKGTTWKTIRSNVKMNEE